MVNRNFIVGVFVAAGLTLFTVGLFLIGNRHEAFARHVELYAGFRDLAGLSKGAKVQVAGMDAGEVVEIGVPDSPLSRFRVRIRINEQFHGLVRTDSVATIGTEGVVGNTFLLIRPGSSTSAVAPALSTLQSKEPTELADLLDQGKGLLTDVDSTVKNADGLLTTVGGNLNTTLTGMRTTVSNVNDVVVGVKKGEGPAGMLLRDESVASQIRQSITNVQQATADVGSASKQVNQLMADIQSRQFPQKLDETMTSVRSATANLDASSRQINQTIAEVTGEDAQGVTAGVNIRQTLSNANAASANLVDDTEALKHNFLIRGFFNRRGYYNLSSIDPEKYRADAAIKRSTRGRIWLSANELFLRDPAGVEQLTTEGKAELNRAIAQYGDSIIQSPIVVEGYSGDHDTADQLVFSRTRANLVRTYLQSHFQLDPENVGGVALMNLPPSGLDRSTWNGVCILVVNGKDRDSRKEREQERPRNASSTAASVGQN